MTEWLRMAFSRLRAVLRKQPLDREFEEELASHLEMLAEEYRRQGLSPDQALRAARLHIGGVDQLREAHRDYRGWPLLEGALQDLCYCLRSWRRSPLFALAAVVTLALGIGINTSVFAFLNAVMLRPYGTPNDDSFVQVYLVPSFVSSSGEVVTGGMRGASYDEYVAFRDGAPSLRTLAGWTERRPMFGAEPEPVRVKLVSHEFLEVFGFREPLLGRWFTPEECAPGVKANVILIGERMWRDRFDADPRILGQTLHLDGQGFTVIGVAPASLRNSALHSEDFLLPYTAEAMINPGSDPFREGEWLEIVGRLKPGARRSQLEAELSVIARRFHQAVPNRLTTVAVTNGAMVYRPFLRGRLAILLPLLQAALGLVLLIACSNVAALLLSRAAARQREIAVRLCLGAGRARLLRQLLTESTLLAMLAGAASVYLAYRVPPLLALMIPAGQRAMMLPEFRPDWTVFAYTFAAALVAGVMAGLAPALESLKIDLNASLKGVGAARRGRRRLRGWLVTAQVAASLVLLAGAGLVLRGLDRARSLGAELEPQSILVADLWFPAGRYTAPAATRVCRRFEERVATMGGIRSIGLSHSLPMRSRDHQTVVLPEGAERQASLRLVTPRYFKTLGIPLLRGRVFTEAEIERSILNQGETHRGRGVWPAVVSRRFGEACWPGQDPLGRQFAVHDFRAEVIGVVADTVHLPYESPLAFYMPFPLETGRSFVLIRFSGESQTLSAAVRELRSELDPGVFRGARTLAAFYEEEFTAFQPVAIVVSVVSAIAFVLAMIGIYGVVAFAVSQRTGELGIRMALGASGEDVIALVLRSGMKPVMAGFAAGLPLTAVGSKLLVRIAPLYGVPPWDPLTHAGVWLLLLSAALAAMLAPALRASRLDPLQSLRHE